MSRLQYTVIILVDLLRNGGGGEGGISKQGFRVLGISEQLGGEKMPTT